MAEKHTWLEREKSYRYLQTEVNLDEKYTIDTK